MNIVIILVITIIGTLQVYYGNENRRKISRFKSILDDSNHVEIHHFLIPKEELSGASLEDVLTSKKYRKDLRDEALSEINDIENKIKELKGVEKSSEKKIKRLENKIKGNEKELLLLGVGDVNYYEVKRQIRFDEESKVHIDEELISIREELESLKVDKEELLNEIGGDGDLDRVETMEVSLINSERKNTFFYEHILMPLNHYLIKNKGAVSDFNLMKDIVDRALDKEEDEISGNLPVPLYLGLTGTMLGVIIGLAAMPNLGVAAAGGGILLGANSLLKGVQFAMIASVIGLGITIYNSRDFYSIRKGAEMKKNNFFTFIQTELLPILSQSTASGIATLQANLLKFNEEFASNMTKFDGVINDVKSSFDDQLEVIKLLEEIDVANIAKYNIKVTKEVSKSFEKLREMGQFLDQLNEFLRSTQKLNFTVNEQLQLAGNISHLIDQFDGNAQNIAAGSNYLQTFFREVESREQAFNDKLVEFSSSTNQLMDEIRISFDNRLRVFNEQDVALNTGFSDLFKNVAEGFDQLFRDLREKTHAIFDDEEENIKGISENINELKSKADTANTLPDKVTAVTEMVDSQNKKIEEHSASIETLLKALNNKPIEYEVPKSLKILMYVTGGLVSVASMLIIYLFVF